VGPQPDGSFVTPANQIVTPAGTQINFTGRPMAVTVRPDQKTAAVLNTGTSQSNFSTSPIVIVDLAAGTIKQEFTPAHANASYDGVIYSKDGAHLYFSQDNGYVTVANVATDGTLTLNTTIQLPASLGAVNNGGLALSADGKTLYVVLNQANSVAVIDLTSNQVTGTISVQNAPASIVVSGEFAYVTNQCGRTAQSGDFTVPSAGTAIVADSASAFSVTGTVSVIDLRTNAVVKNISVGLQPTAILAAANGLIYVANTNSDSISVIDPAINIVIATQRISVYPNAPLGSFPNGLAFTSANDLVVSLGANNAVAFYSSAKDGSLTFEGFVPAAWYPSQVADAGALTAAQSGTGRKLLERIIIANTKGTGLGSEVPNSGNPSGKNSHSFVGSVSIVTLPSGKDFASYDRQVAANNGWDRLAERQERDQFGVFGPDHPIKHVFYVIKENTTYDQVLGDDPRGNGDLTLVQWDQNVTPNEHALAQKYVLFDNFYDSSVLSADGHQWAVQAVAPDYMEHLFTDFNRSYPSNGGDSMDYLPTAFLWSNALEHGLSVRIYGEYASSGNPPGFVCPPGTPFPTWSQWYNDSQILEGKITGTLTVPVGLCHTVTDIPSVTANIYPAYPQFNTGIPDQYRFDVFLPEFQAYVANNNLPNLIIMKICDDHTSGNSVGFPTPAAQNADNDLAVGRLVDLVSHSIYWKDSAIVMVEDDPQNGVDHVDGHRSTAFVISPYTKRGAVNHTYYTQVNLVRTIEDMLGLPPMNQHDQLVSPMEDAFTNDADLSTYTVIPNNIPLDTMNVMAKTKLEKAWQVEVAKYFPRGPDQEADLADPNLLNHAIWYTNTHFSKPFPGEKRVLYPSQLHAAPGKKTNKPPEQPVRDRNRPSQEQ
jgi:YVTN family beta-propeller protein